MAEYRNERNQITIDRSVAENDINIIKTAISKLEEAKRDITRIAIPAHDEGRLSGVYMDAIVYKTTYLKKSIESEIEKLTRLVNYINDTIEKYERLDMQLKNSMESNLKK